MHITLNGEPREVADAYTVKQLLDDMDLGGKRIALEINLEIVPRSQHGTWVLQAGDKVEVVQAIGGG